MWSIIPSLDALLQALAVAFTEPSFQTHRDLFLGWIMCIGKRTEYRVFQTIHASSVLLTFKIFEACADFLMPDGHRSCASAEISAPIVHSCSHAVAAWPRRTTNLESLVFSARLSNWARL